MRKVVAGLFISLDGVTESPDQWQFDHFDAGMAKELESQLAMLDTVLLGRVTYEEWAPYWPTASADEEFAKYINNAPKYVFSTTLEKVEWGQYSDTITLVKDAASTIAKLKQQPGKNIGTAGSPGLVRSLLQNDLLDELRLHVHPVVVNKGKRLFREGGDLKRLKLVETTTTPTGVVIMVYQPRGSA